MNYDFLIIGAGLSGAAAAAELASAGRTLLLEADAMPGMHSTGRSAAMFTPHFGEPQVRLLNQASEPMLREPPPGFASAPLLTPRGALTIAGPGEEAALEAHLALSTESHPIHALTAAQALEKMPLLKPSCVAAAAFEPGVMDMDVDALLQGCLKRFRQAGGQLKCGQRVVACQRQAGGTQAGGPQTGGWRVETATEQFSARVVVNAAGAWATKVAEMAGACALALEPRRRTAILVDAPAGQDISRMPLVDFAAHPWYIKPDAGRLMASLGDQTPMPAQDIQPDELDVAMTVDVLETQTSVEVRHLSHQWAGLRTFAPDERPVVGFDNQAEGFFWLAGQGGYGIMMALSLAQAVRGLIVEGDLPEDLRERGLSAAALAPGRPGISA